MSLFVMIGLGIYVGMNARELGQSITLLVCNLHFTEQSYHEAGRKRQRTTTWTNQMLIVDAVPTVFKCFPELLQATFSKQKAPTINNALQPKQKSKLDAMANGGKNTGEASQDAVGEQGGDDACAGG